MAGFQLATAEHVVLAVDAVLSLQGCESAYVAEFADLSPTQADPALALGVELGLLFEDSGCYRTVSPLCVLLATGSEPQRAIAMRVLLGGYEPFCFFAERLTVTEDPLRAAHETRARCQLTPSKKDVRDTMISLGTYAGSIVQLGGGRYESVERVGEHDLAELAAACDSTAAATALVADRIGSTVTDKLSRPDVLEPLASAILKARGGDPRGAVVLAGNAIESFLLEFAAQRQAPLGNASGINAKLDALATSSCISKKHVYFGKYIGHLRNAADHGVDPEIGASWDISEDSGTEFVFVSCSFIRSVMHHHAGRYVL